MALKPRIVASAEAARRPAGKAATGLATACFPDFPIGANRSLTG
jgi:hypothetical protein